ncbi:hypothetical protein GJ744_011720 [Endocarpon pusillum]|uniref:Large ribosomal subunit protein mL49 n=1 Tax=Endocarpon pusillum TaxID=364733 RepID=A0A8H7E2M5_9EURO|nr:hypothetical protein GJ744_011720 [Endocarpon pusillum]
MRPPSTALLGAILRPVTKCRAQTRASSNGYNVTLLDKLHRKQKEAMRQERLASVQRARSNPDFASKTSVPTGLASSSSEAPDGTMQPPASPPNLPYTITRTRPGRQLPVYSLSKGGGTKHITRLRKLSGNLSALKADLTKALGLEGGLTNQRGEHVEGVSVNWHTKHIIVRGWRAPEIKAWAESRGF